MHTSSARQSLKSSTRAVLALAFMLPACACTSLTAVNGMAPIVGAPSLQSPVVTVRVMPGDTLSIISQRHGVPMNAILAANSLTNANTIRVGQTLRIPASVAAPSAVAVLSPATPFQPSMADIAARPAPSIPAISAPSAPRPIVSRSKPTHSNIDRDAERELLVSARMTSLAKPSLKPRDFAMNMTPPAAKPMTGMGGPLIAEKPQQMAAVDPSKAVVVSPETSPSAGQPDDFTATNKFIWPVSGRVISSFGEMANGYANDGINIEVEDGTPVKAADHGVVIYAGNELAGFGNLLLVKHSNGYVTAYAHNSRLLARKGSKVRQGQVIAHAGRSGDVSKPQVHFEIRRGDKPVDPKRYIGNASVSL